MSCNNACVFCAQGRLRETRARIDAKAEVDAIETNDVVALVGGEPTIHGDLVDLIEAVDARSPSRIVLQTNARRLAYPSYARALREASRVLSLDASLTGS